MKILAIDYGDARTGIAVSDLTGSIVGFTTVIHARTPEKTLAGLEPLLAAHRPEALVLGLPRNMDGTEGPRAEHCRAFAERLRERFGLPVALWDERRTTVEAHDILSTAGYHGKKRKNTVDAVAASLILEGYLAWRKNHPDEEKS